MAPRLVALSPSKTSLNFCIWLCQSMLARFDQIPAVQPRGAFDVVLYADSFELVRTADLDDIGADGSMRRQRIRLSSVKRMLLLPTRDDPAYVLFALQIDPPLLESGTAHPFLTLQLSRLDARNVVLSKGSGSDADKKAYFGPAHLVISEIFKDLMCSLDIVGPVPELTGSHTMIQTFRNNVPITLYLLDDALFCIPHSDASTADTHLRNIAAVSFSLITKNPGPSVTLKVFGRYADDVFVGIPPHTYAGLVAYFRTRSVRVLAEIDVKDEFFVAELARAAAAVISSAGTLADNEVVEVFTTVQTSLVGIEEVGAVIEDTGAGYRARMDDLAGLTLHETITISDMDGQVLKSEVSTSEVVSEIPAGVVEGLEVTAIVDDKAVLAESSEAASAEVITTTVVEETVFEDDPMVEAGAVEVAEGTLAAIDNTRNLQFIPQVTAAVQDLPQHNIIADETARVQGGDANHIPEVQDVGAGKIVLTVDSENDGSEVVATVESVSKTQVTGEPDDKINTVVATHLILADEPTSVPVRISSYSNGTQRNSFGDSSHEFRVRPKTMSGLQTSNSEKRNSRTLLSWIFGADRSNTSSPVTQSSPKSSLDLTHGRLDEEGAESGSYSGGPVSMDRRPSSSASWRVFKRSSTLTARSPVPSQPKLSPEEVSTIVQNLVDNSPNLIAVNLRDCQILTSAQSLMIAAGLAQNNFVKSLNMTNCKLNATFALKVAEALQTNTTLEILNLERNLIGPQGIKAISAILADNKSLTELLLANQAVTAGLDAEQALARNMAKNHQLLHFTASIRDSSSRNVIERAIARNTKVHKRPLPL